MIYLFLSNSGGKRAAPTEKIEFVTLWHVALVSHERQQDEVPLSSYQCSVHEKLISFICKVLNLKFTILSSPSHLRQELVDIYLVYTRDSDYSKFSWWENWQV